jgi:hypothetical protein
MCANGSLLATCTQILVPEQHPPVLRVHPQSTSLPTDGEVTLSVELEPGCHPPPSFQWFCDGMALPGAHGRELRLSEEMLDGNDSLFCVRVENSEGVVVSREALVVRGDAVVATGPAAASGGAAASAAGAGAAAGARAGAGVGSGSGSGGAGTATSTAAARASADSASRRPQHSDGFSLPLQSGPRRGSDVSDGDRVDDELAVEMRSNGDASPDERHRDIAGAPCLAVAVVVRWWWWWWC